MTYQTFLEIPLAKVFLLAHLSKSYTYLAVSFCSWDPPGRPPFASDQKMTLTCHKSSKVAVSVTWPWRVMSACGGNSMASKTIAHHPYPNQFSRYRRMCLWVTTTAWAALTATHYSKSAEGWQKLPWALGEGDDRTILLTQSPSMVSQLFCMSLGDNEPVGYAS